MDDLIYIIVPVFNEEKNLKSFLSQLARYSKNIIVVNDGSTDRSSKILDTFNVSVINHSKNLGKGAAMRTGILYAITKKANSVIFMDADGQHKPEDINLFSKELDKSNDLVFGNRKYSLKIPLIKNIGKIIVTKLINIIFRTNRSDVLCGFFALNVKKYPLIKWSSNDYGVETEIAIKVAKNRIKFAEVDVNSNYFEKNKEIGIKDVIATVINIPRWIIS